MKYTIQGFWLVSVDISLLKVNNEIKRTIYLKCVHKLAIKDTRTTRMIGTLNRFYTLLRCFHCWLWTIKYRLEFIITFFCYGIVKIIKSQIYFISENWSFIKRQTSDTSTGNEWQWVTTNDNEWYNGNSDWYKKSQRMTSDSEWQRVTTNDNELSFQLNFLFFRIKEKPTTKHSKENSLSVEEDLEERLLNWELKKVPQKKY